MKVWVTTSIGSGLLEVWTKKPSLWMGKHSGYGAGDSGAELTCICRDALRPLFTQAGARQPKHMTKQIVELELSAKAAK